MKTQAIIKKVKYFPEELMRIYLDTKYYGTTRIMFNLVNILILFGAVTILILPHIYFWDKHRLDEMNSFSISYIALQILVFIICLWILSIRDNKRYRNVGIKTGRFFISSDARNEFVDKKFNFFYKELVSSAILTGNKEKDILRLKQYIPFIDEEKKFWYSIPAVYIGTVFVLLYGPFWSTVLDSFMRQATDNKSYVLHLSLCSFVLIIQLIAFLFLVVLYDRYKEYYNRKSHNYKELKRYLNILLINIEQE